MKNPRAKKRKPPLHRPEIWISPARAQTLFQAYLEAARRAEEQVLGVPRYWLLPQGDIKDEPHAINTESDELVERVRRLFEQT